MNRIPHLLRHTAALVLAVFAGVAAPALGAQQAGGEDLVNVTLTFHIIEADGFNTVDPAIVDVVDELRKLFRYDGYRLMSSSVLTAGVGPEDYAQVSQMMAAPEGGYQYRIASLIQLVDRSDRILRVAVELQHGSRAVFGDDPTAVPLLVEASVNVREGQTVVLGSAKPTTEGAAIILVMTPSYSTP